MTLKNILDATTVESQQRQHKYPLAMVQRKVEKMGPTRGFAHALRQKTFSVIAEIKRKSPSMGSINQAAIDVAHKIYNDHAMVSAISVLTQESHFGGTPQDLEDVRKFTQRHPKPILRKDFIFTEYEVYFSRWIGADAILLMANVVENKEEFKRLHDLAVSIGLDVLCEVHDEAEIAILPDTVKICGINSRRFKGVSQRKPIWLRVTEEVFMTSTNRDTQTDIRSFDLFEKLNLHLPSECLKIAESGISAGNIGRVLKKYPFNAALIGTALLKSHKNEMSALLDKIQSEADSALGLAPSSAVKTEATYAAKAYHPHPVASS
jgi:indole-3-glycerol phosphate synthase